MGFKVLFLTIGYIEWRKGQDLLIDAIEQLHPDILEKAEFILVGQNTSQMANELNDRITEMSNVKMVGTVPREEVHSMLDNADVLICPSREDPMPTVCAEAMMHHTPCLVSDATGTSAYIKDGHDGLIFKSGNISELKEKISWCVSNVDDLQVLGDRAHEIYENIFSPQVFEKSLIKYVEEMVGEA